MTKRNSIQCPQIDEYQCRINTIHLTMGQGGVRTISVRRLHWKRKVTFWNIFANGVFRCHLGSGVSQLLLCYQQPSYWGGGGGVCIFQKQIFLPKLRPNSFHSSVTIVINREGWDTNIPSYTVRGGGGWRMPNSAKLLSRIKAPM